MSPRLPARLRVPPFLPAYTVLAIVVAYAVASLWLGLARLDAIIRFVESGALAAATMHDLEALQNATNDIEAGSRGFALTADESYLELFERGQRNVPRLLAKLRDHLREQTEELAMIETLVPLIAERTAISASAIERIRTAPGEPYETVFGRRGKETSDQIRAIISALETRERDTLARNRRILDAKVSEARRDMYLMAGLTLLLAVSLFLAVRRLRGFIPVIHGAMPADFPDVKSAGSLHAPDAGVGTLLRDALLRARLASAASRPGSTEETRLRALVTTLENTLREHDGVLRDLGQPRPEERDLPQAIALLAQRYSQPAALTVNVTIDRQTRVDGVQKAFLVFRSAEWALEAISLRKSAGEVSLQLAANGRDVALRVMALADHPGLRVTLTPKEREEAFVLQQGLAMHGGTFVASDGPTGFGLTVNVPVDD